MNLQFSLRFGVLPPLPTLPPPAPKTQIFAVPQMAAALGVSEQKITAMCRSGKIPATKASTKVWYCTAQNWALFLEQQSIVALRETEARARKTADRAAKRREMQARAIAQQKAAQRRAAAN